MGTDSKNDNNKSSNVTGGPLQVPPEVKKIVQSLKEIVSKNCTDSEIYAVLVECNMDPNEAVQRLLYQDTFKEVKSKRERRKEMKERHESRAWSNSGTGNRGVRFGTEQTVGQAGSTENNYNELGKTACKREIGSAAPSGSSTSSYMYHVTRKNINEQPPIHSDFFNADNRRQLIGTGDTISSSVQSSLRHQPTWAGVSKGQVSMADIVRGRPPNNSAKMSSEISCTSQPAVLPNSSHDHNKSPKVLSSQESELHEDPHSSHPSNVSEMIPGSAGQRDVDNEWPVIEHLPAATGSLVIDESAASGAEMYSNRFCLHGDGAKFSRNSQSDNIQISERHYDSQNQSSNSYGSASAPSRQIFADGAGRESSDDLLKETSYFDSRGRMFQKGNVSDLSFPNYSSSLNDDVLSAVSSVVANLQQLNIGKEELEVPPTENHSAVVLPNHLQPFAADCSHLSFGTYKSGVSSSSLTASNQIESNLEVSAADGSSAVYSNFRNSEYCDDVQLGFTHDTQRATADARNYDLPVSSQPELMKQDIPDATCGNQYISSLSFPDTSINNIQQSGSDFLSVADPNARNHPSVPSEMYLENLPSGLLVPPDLSLRMRDSSSFLASQSMPSGYGSEVSSYPTIPTSEIHIMVFSSGTFSLPQLSPDALPGSNLARGAVLPPRQPVHSYSRSRLPSNELGNINMIDYASMPQRQTYPETSLFRGSMAGMNYDPRRYRSSATMGGLPLSNNGLSVYGSFVGNSSNIPESFSRNQSPIIRGTAVGYSDLLHSHHMDGNSLPHDQNNRSPTWDLGAGRQTSMLSDSTYYSLLGQNQHHRRYQSDQQASRRYESLGYPNTYNSDRITGTTAPRLRPW